MRKVIPILCAVLVGLFTLISIIFRPFFEPYLATVLQWGIVLASVATLVGITNLMLTHTRRVVQGKRGFFFSLIVLFSFSISLIGGLLLGADNPGYLRWVSSIRIPLEVSLMGLLALTLTYAGIQFFRTKGWTPLSLSFGISVLVFLVLGMGFIQAMGNPVIDQVVAFVQRLPIAGGRGILIGISLGALLTGLRVLFGAERPYGE
jgi:hypothetical protein